MNKQCYNCYMNVNQVYSQCKECECYFCASCSETTFTNDYDVCKECMTTFEEEVEEAEKVFYTPHNELEERWSYDDDGVHVIKYKNNVIKEQFFIPLNKNQINYFN